MDIPKFTISFYSAHLCHTVLNSADLEEAKFDGAIIKGIKLDLAKNVPTDLIGK